MAKKRKCAHLKITEWAENYLDGICRKYIITSEKTQLYWKGTM